VDALRTATAAGADRLAKGLAAVEKSLPGADLENTPDDPDGPETHGPDHGPPIPAANPGLDEAVKSLT
jgi:hypothetical protein